MDEGSGPSVCRSASDRGQGGAFKIGQEGFIQNCAPIPEHEKVAEDWLKRGYELGIDRCYEEAIQCFNMALCLNSEDPLAWKGKGLALEASGRRSEAHRAFARARDLGLMAEARHLCDAVSPE